MAMLVVVVPAGRETLSLGPTALEELAALGVTSVSLARDTQTNVVVLEGWAFDPSSREPVLAALQAGEGARPLHEIVHMAVTAATRGG